MQEGAGVRQGPINAAAEHRVLHSSRAITAHAGGRLRRCSACSGSAPTASGPRLDQVAVLLFVISGVPSTAGFGQYVPKNAGRMELHCQMWQGGKGVARGCGLACEMQEEGGWEAGEGSRLKHQGHLPRLDGEGVGQSEEGDWRGWPSSWPSLAATR